jgi:hypothetical protein
MSTGNEPPARMRLHVIWGDMSESHVDAFTQYDQLTPNKPKGILIIHTKYLDEQGNQTHNGHWLAGSDHYYFRATGTNSTTGGPQNIEYATWNDPVTGQTRTTVYELRGYGQEIKRDNVRVNTFLTNAIWDGKLVSDELYEQAVQRSFSPEFLAL